MKVSKPDRVLKVADVSSLAFASKAELVARTGKVVEVVDVATGASQRQIAVGPEGYRITTIDGLVFAGHKTLAGYEVATGKKVVSFKGHTQEVLAIAAAHERKLLATGSADNTLRVWDRTSGAQLAKIAHGKRSVVAVAFAPDAKSVYSVDADEALRCFEVPSGKRKLEVQIDPDSRSDDAVLAASIDGRVVTAVGSRTNEEPGQQPVRIWKDGTIAASPAWPALKSGHFAVRSAAFSTRGELLVVVVWHDYNSSSRVMAIELWDAKTAKHVRRIALSTNRIFDVAFSPDDSLLAAATSDHIALFDLA